MGKIIICNGSPRAPKSNSKRYAEIFTQYYKGEIQYHNITKNNHKELCGKIEGHSDILFVFPLYADGIPVTLLNFLKTLEENPPQNKPIVSILINCGFLEFQQNDVAVQMIALFCKQNGYQLGSVLKIGSGEAILDTPFAFLAKRKIKKLAHTIMSQKYITLHTAMPLTKKLFIKASTNYWMTCGKKHGITKEDMQTMQIES